MLESNISSKSFPHCQRHSDLLWTAANSCGRYDSTSRARLYTPRPNENPSLCDREKYLQRSTALFVLGCLGQIIRGSQEATSAIVPQKESSYS